MKKLILVTFVLLLAGLVLRIFAFNGTVANAFYSKDDVIEKRINANLLRVRVNGKWHDVPMIELSERLCNSDHPMFRRYCE